jgi:hypothetical protein
MSRDDTRHLLRSPKNAARLKRARSQFEAGQGGIVHARGVGRNPASAGVRELAMAIIDDMHASGLGPADQANALAHGLLAWSSNLTAEARDRFLRDFVTLLHDLRSAAEAAIRDEENALQ